MADKKFTLTFDVEGNIGPIKKSINEFQSTVKNSKVKIPVNIQGNIDKTIARLTDEIENFENIAGQGFSNMAEIGKAEKSFSKISSLMKQLGKYGNQIGGLDPKKFLPKETIDRVEKLQRSWNKVNTIVQKGEANKSAIEKQTKAIKEQQEALNELATERKKLNAENVEAGRRKSGLTNKIKADTKRRDEVQSEMSELEKTKGGKSTGEYKKLSSELKVLNAQIEANRKEYTALDAAISKNKTTIAGLDVSIKDAKTSLTDMETVLQQLQQAAQNPKELEDLRQELAGLTEVNLDEIPTDLEEIRKIIESLDDAELKNIEEAFKKIQASSEDTKQAVKEAGDAFEETSKQGVEFEKTADQINRLKSQIIDFFSIGNTIQIFKSAIRDAFNTVKELDAAMTETAVVTDFSIGDMWEKLPEYSARASELGASTKSLYEATTLYYQQGLQSAEAMDVGIETMKMARIANMDAANATEAMTAALRGFNMEINETSAGRINDVYSELAAITASDTQQIATAMTKTASIAYSANMEFETTAALLAQIIETTQEAPETAGTAMKTIIARFTEVKELFSKGMLTGEDAEGEEININKIDAALRTVGISLKDFLNGKKGIDDIFLELASKWDSLDLATQRYIATTAAGSRQQSRFIAMMSNYDRTMELVNAANNSAGASTEQFNKTLESLDAKLQRLNNAWQEFTMNLANNEIIKIFVDMLANGLETINSVTDALSGGNGMIKSLLTLAEVALGLKAGGSIFRAIFSGFKQGGDSKGIFDYAQEILAIFSKDDDSAKGGILKQIFELIAGNEEASDSLRDLGERVGDAQDQLSGLFGKFGPWTLLIVGMAVAVYQLVKAFQAVQTSAQLENLNEQLRELEKESERVKNKVSEIGDSKNNLGGLQDTLYGLTKGTGEWKKALMDVNTEVLRLIEQYPELELTSGHYGELAISEDSWDALLDKQEQVISNIGAMAVATQIQKAELETQMTYDDFIINSGYGLEAKTKVVKESPWKNLFATAGLLNTATGIPVTLDEQSQKVLEASQGETSIKEVELSEFERSLNYFSQIALPRFFDSSFGTTGSTWGDIITGVSEGLANANSGYTSNSAILTNTHEQIKQDGGYLRAAQEEITGLASEDFMKLSAAWYDAGLYFANGTFDEEMAYAIYRDLGFTDNQVFASIVAEGERLGGEFDNLAMSAQNLANKEELLADSYINNALAKSTKISGSDAEKGIQGLINSIESREDYDARLDEKTALIEETYRGRERDLARQYAELTGKHYEAGKIWSDSSMADEIQIDYSEMAKAVAEIQLQVDYQNMGEAILKGLVDLNKQEKDLFNSVFGRDGQAITSEQIKKYASEDGINIDQIVKDMGYDDLSHMAKEMDLNPAQILDTVNTIIDNFEQAHNRIAEARQGIVKNMSKYSKNALPKTFKENAKILESWEIKFGEEIRNDLTTFFDKMAQTGDEDLTSTALEQLYQTLEQTGNEQEIGKVFDFINTIDFSNPIEALDAINNEIENGTGAARDFAKTLKETESPYFGLQSQLSSFVGSEDFQGVQEELAEILETNEEISATDVYDLADSYKSLNKLLKNNNITAAGLAKTLEGIQKGEFTVNQLTDAVLASISTFDSLDSIVAKTVRDFENFDLGIDEGAIADNISGWVEILEENLEDGAVGNSQNFRILDYLFPGWSEDLEGDALVDKMTYLTEKLKGNGQNLRTMWSDLAAGKDIYGNAWEFDKDSGRTADDLKITDTGSDIKLTGWEGKDMTTQDMVDWIADAYNTSSEMASAMLTDFKNNSADLAKELQENDYVSGLKKAYDELKTLEEVKIISEEEIEAISNLTGKSIDTVRQDLQNKGAQTVDLYDDEGRLRSLEDIILQAESAVLAAKNAGQEFTYDFTSDFITKTEKGIESIDLKAFEKKLGQLNIFGAEAEGLKEQLFEQTIAGLKEGAEDGKAILVETLSDGTQLQIEVDANTSYEKYQQEVAKAMKDAEYKAMATAFADVFGEIEIKFKIDSAIVDWLKSLGVNLPFSLDPASVEEAKTQVNTIAEEKEVPFIFQALNSIKDLMWYPGPIPLQFQAIVSVSKIVTSIIGAVTGAVEEEKGSTSGSDSSGTTTNQYKRDFNNRGATQADGITNAPYSHIALVSEEGPELIQKAEGGAYLSGLNGPEIAEIDRGDTVYTAEQTNEIFKKRKHNMIPRFGDGKASGYGYGSAYSGSSGGKGGGGSGSSKEEEKWENPFDKLYNLLRKIDEELRERERIERRYEKLLEGIDVSANKIIKISQEELAQLEKERMLQEQLVDGRKWQIEQYQRENADLSRYAAVTKNERGESVLRVDWDLINQITDTEQGERVEAYVNQLEEWFDTLEEAEDTLWEIEDAVKEIKERGKDEYFELEDLIKEALTQFYQEEIDKLNSINTSINDTNSSLLEAVQKSIDKQRQDRENDRTERELAEKQRRLAYLQQDTSGANALEILKLQKEIAEGQEDYTDTLIDQKISELQEQNEEAAKQREQQITLLQTQLDHYLEMGGIWEEVYALIDEGLDRETGLIRGSTLESLLKSTEGFSGLSTIGQMEWLKETNSMIAQALAYLENGRQLEDLGIAEGSQIEFVTKNGKTMTGTVDAKGNVVGADGKTYNNVYQGIDGKYYAGENIEETKPPVVEGVPGTSQGGTSGSSGESESKNNPYGKASQSGNYTARNGPRPGGNAVKAIQWALKDMGYNPGAIDGIYGSGTAAAVKAFQRAVGISADGDYGPKTREQFRLKGYNKGGLADFTGPAWLDGTKARPEIVLDAQDSRNFIQLRDILGSLLNRGSTSSTSTENNGDITYDIDINVESIGNDYDVEQMANKVKNLIGEDARYRNNNAVSLKK